MTITSNDIAFYKSAVVDRTTSNGGLRSYNLVNFSKVGDLIPPASVSDAATGITLYTKFFVKLTNTDDEPLYNTYLGLTGIDSVDDYYYAILGDNEDTQADATGYTAWAAGGDLNTLITAGDTTFDIDTENGDGILAAGMCYLTDGVHSELFPTSNVSYVGTVATVTVDSSYNSGQLKYSYAVIDTTFSSLLDLSNITTSWAMVANPNSLVVTGDITTYNAGTVFAEYKAVFTDTTVYDLYEINDLVNPIATSCSVSSDESVQNDNEVTGHYLFTIPSGFFPTAVSGNTYTFSTSPAEAGIWIKRVVPTGANSGTVNLNIRIVGEAV